MASVHPDPGAAVGFYTELFGWDADPMEFGGVRITLWRLPGYEGGEPGQPVPADVVAVMAPSADRSSDTPAHWSVDFWVADATADRAAALGASLLAPPFDTPVGRTAVLADPQGAAFSVSTAPTAGRP